MICSQKHHFKGFARKDSTMADKKNTWHVSDDLVLMNEWANDRNKELKIMPDKVSVGSQKRAYWICAKHNTLYQQIIRDRAKGKRGCPFCFADWKVSISRERYITGKKTLAETHPELVKEWVECDNPKFTPDTCVAGSNVMVIWKCKICNGKYKATIANRALNKSSCPYCAGQKVLVGYNDLKSRAPELAEEWSEKNTLLQTQVTSHSNKKVYWKCRFGHADYLMSIKQRRNGQGCPICALQSQTSFPEQAIYYYLKKVFPDAINRYRSDSKEIDIYIPSQNCGIEYNGYFFHKEKEKKDSDKKQYYLSIGIKLIIIKEYKKEAEKINADYYIHGRVSFKDLNKLICALLKELNRSVDIDVDCDRDAIKIKKQYVALKKENSIAFLRPDLIGRWDYEKNGTITPEMVSLGTKMKYYWKCRICNRSYLAPPNRIANGSACSKHFDIYKAGQNDFETRHPDLLKYWDYEKNDVLPCEVFGGGERIIYWLCDKGHSYRKSIQKRVAGEACPFCAGKSVLEGFNDLASQFADIADTWNFKKNKGLLPTQITPHSNKKYWWKCKLGHEWESTASNRVAGKGCPYCASIKVLAGFNDLKTRFPEIAQEWNYNLNDQLPEEFLPYSHKKVWWKCKDGHEWQAVISNRTGGNTSCPICYAKRLKMTSKDK